MNCPTLIMFTVFGISLSAAGEIPCTPLKDSDRAALSGYVQKKYKLPDSVALEIHELSFVEGSCYRRLKFQAASGSRAFQMDLIASPDLRYLTRDLMDSRIDPVKEEAQRAAALAERLTRGRFAERGSKNADVTLTLFSDFECPYCARMAKGLMDDILPGNKESVRLIFRNFPLPMHPWARPAAEAAACAQLQGDAYFWKLHDYIFDHQKNLNADGLKGALLEQAAAWPAFNLQSFIGCLNAKTTASQIEEDLALGKDLGVTGTPTLYIDGERIVGYNPDQIRTLIREKKHPAQTIATTSSRH